MSLIMKKHVVCNYDSSMDFAGVTVQITFTYESTQCALVFLNHWNLALCLECNFVTNMDISNRA